MLDYHAPSKKKYIGENQAPLLTKEFNKEIMIDQDREINFFALDFKENKKPYNEQRNHCVKLARNDKKISL